MPPIAELRAEWFGSLLTRWRIWGPRDSGENPRIELMPPLRYRSVNGTSVPSRLVIQPRLKLARATTRGVPSG